MISDEDRRILALLKDDSSLSVRSIAEKTGIPATTVHSHIRRLKKNGIIKRYTIELDMAKLGRPITAYVLLTADSGYLHRSNVSQDSIVQKLIQHPLVEEAVTLTGRYDFLLRMQAVDIRELNDVMVSFVRQVEGIQRTETFLVLYTAERGQDLTQQTASKKKIREE